MERQSYDDPSIDKTVNSAKFLAYRENRALKAEQKEVKGGAKDLEKLCGVVARLEKLVAKYIEDKIDVPHDLKDGIRLLREEIDRLSGDQAVYNRTQENAIKEDERREKGKKITNFFRGGKGSEEKTPEEPIGEGKK